MSSLSHKFIIAITLSISILSRTPVVFSYYADITDLSSLYEILLQQITSFPLSQFQSDPELVQEVNKINHTTTYKFLEEDVVLFARPVDDTNKKVVVLTRKEDQIPFRKAKRGYVVFSKNSVDASYFGQFALIRPTLSPYDKNTVLINGGVRSFIEWIPFDGHWVKGRIPKKEIAMSCVSSLLVSCFFNGSSLADKKIVSATVPYITDTPTKGEIAETEILQWITHDESDPDENYDYYGDITLGPITGNASVPDITEAIELQTKSLLCLATPEVCNLGDKEFPSIGLLPIISSLGSNNGPVPQRTKREAVKPPAYYPGWKTQYITPVSGSYLITPKPAEFYGFGNCPFNNTLGPDYLYTSATSVDDFLDFYLTILRVGCISTTKLLLQEILKSGILIVDTTEKVFEIKLFHKYLTQAKLTTDEYIHLGTAFEFATFTQNYAFSFSPTFQKNKKRAASVTSTNFTTPTGKPGSPSIAFVTTLIIDYLKTIREKARPHMLYLTRAVVQNTRFILYKLTQDAKNLAQSCRDGGCDKDKAVNYNDRVHVMGLNQFIKRGLGPVEQELVDMNDAFIQFFKDNESNIEKFVMVYAS